MCIVWFGWLVEIIGGVMTRWWMAFSINKSFLFLKFVMYFRFVCADNYVL
jgi:hypothetical protein